MINTPVEYKLEGKLLKGKNPAELAKKIGKILGRKFRVNLETREISEKVPSPSGKSIEKVLGTCDLISA